MLFKEEHGENSSKLLDCVTTCNQAEGEEPDEVLEPNWSPNHEPKFQVGLN